CGSEPRATRWKPRTCSSGALPKAEDCPLVRSMQSSRTGTPTSGAWQVKNWPLKSLSKHSSACPRTPASHRIYHANCPNMLDRLAEAQSYARPLLTNFRVGAVVRGTSGALYLGANLEFPGVGLNQTVHAE